MKRRLPFVIALVGLLATPAGSLAAEMARVAAMTFGQRTSERVLYYDAFRDELHALGWEEGRNLVLDFGSLWGGSDDLDDRAVKVVAAKPDVILAGGGPVTVRALRRATATIPIVMIAAVGGGDVLAGGLIGSLAHPGGNITGIGLSADLNAKRLDILTQAFPQAKRVAVVWHETTGAQQAGFVEGIRVAAAALGIEVVLLDVGSQQQFPRVLREIEAARVDAIEVLPDPAILESHTSETLNLAATTRLPAIYAWRSYVNAGGLLSYGASLPDLFRGAAHYADRILRGVRPDELPVQQPTRFELVINLKTAKALGLTIPQSIIARADEVIE
jgi:putative ABC transport system substrate-binding protein